jgi:hypothetical protein
MVKRRGINMSQSTKLLISRRWSVSNIKTVIESYISNYIEIENKNAIAPEMFTATFKYNGEERMMYIHGDVKSPIGDMIQLSLRQDKSSIEIMNIIAKIFGGLIQENDSYENYKMVDGQFDEENGLLYFLKYAILHNEMKDYNDLKGLINCIKEWEKRIGRNQSNIIGLNKGD